MKRLPQFLLLGIVCAYFASCKYDNEEDLYPNSSCDTTDVVYDNEIELIVQAQCATTGCHVSGGSGSGIFENYAGVKAKVDNGSFLNRTVVLRDMPSNGSLSECNIQKITTWIANGAPKN